VVDIGMPGRNGYDVARKLRERMTGVKLIAPTGWGADADVQQARAAGFDHHLTKPVDPAALNELLAKSRPSPRA
jgi:CheY-like chemotaxis protein